LTNIPENFIEETPGYSILCPGRLDPTGCCTVCGAYGEEQKRKHGCKSRKRYAKIVDYAPSLDTWLGHGELIARKLRLDAGKLLYERWRAWYFYNPHMTEELAKDLFQSSVLSNLAGRIQ